MTRISKFSFSWALCILFPTAAGAVLPESGQYWSRDYPGLGVTIERQGRQIAIAAYAADKQGNPITLIAAGPLQEGGSLDSFDPPPAQDAGISPVHSVSADLFVVRNGSCLGCDPVVASLLLPQKVGRVVVTFSFLKTPSLEIIEDTSVQPSLIRAGTIGLEPYVFGHSVWGNTSASPGGYVDLRGFWYFSDEIDGEPSMQGLSINFSQPMIESTSDALTIVHEEWPIGQSFDPVSNVPSGRYLVCVDYRKPTAQTPYDGCELKTRDGTVVLSFDERDIGIDRIVTFRGPLAARSSGIVRNGIRGVGVRMRQ